MKRIVIFILSLIALVSLVGCKTSKHVNNDIVSVNKHEVRDHDSLIAGSSYQNTIKSMSNIELDLDIEHIEYDTSVTDSTGMHPIKSKIHLKGNARKVDENEATNESNDSLVKHHDIDVALNDSVVDNSEFEKKSTVSDGVNWAIVIGVALFVILFFKSIFK